jgi:hypothetical protein
LQDLHRCVLLTSCNVHCALALDDRPAGVLESHLSWVPAYVVDKGGTRLAP